METQEFVLTTKVEGVNSVIVGFASVKRFTSLIEFLQHVVYVLMRFTSVWVYVFVEFTSMCAFHPCGFMSTCVLCMDLMSVWGLRSNNFSPCRFTYLCGVYAHLGLCPCDFTSRWIYIRLGFAAGAHLYWVLFLMCFSVSNLGGQPALEFYPSKSMVIAFLLFCPSGLQRLHQNLASLYLGA